MLTTDEHGLPEGIEWRGKRSDAAGMARVRILTS